MQRLAVTGERFLSHSSHFFLKKAPHARIIGCCITAHKRLYSGQLFQRCQIRTRFTQYLKYCIVVLIPRPHPFFRKFGKISGSWWPSLIIFHQIRTRFTQYLKYCIVVLLPGPHPFFRKFEKISGSWRPSLFLFHQIRTLFTQYSKYYIVVLIPRLHQFFKKFGKNIRAMVAIFNLFFIKLGPELFNIYCFIYYCPYV